MPYGVMCTVKGLTARCSLWGWMLLRRATARVWERPSLIHTASARAAAGFRQSMMMPVIVRLWVVSDTLAGGGTDAGDGVVVMESAGLAPCVVSVLGLLGGGVYACVFGLLAGAVCRVEGGGPGGGVMEGGVWEVPLCCPRVQGGRGGPLRLYGVSLVVSAMGDEDVGGRQLIHLCGVGEVAGDGDLGGVVLAGGGVGDDVVGCPFIVGGLLHVSSLSGGWSGFGDGGFACAFAWGATLVSTRYCGLQVSGAPTLVAAAALSWRRAVVLVSRWGGWLGGEGVVVLMCPQNYVASLGVAVRGPGLDLLDGQRGPGVLRCLWVYGCGVRP